MLLTLQSSWHGACRFTVTRCCTCRVDQVKQLHGEAVAWHVTTQGTSKHSSFSLQCASCLPWAWASSVWSPFRLNTWSTALNIACTSESLQSCYKVAQPAPLRGCYVHATSAGRVHSELMKLYSSPHLTSEHSHPRGWAVVAHCDSDLYFSEG